MKRRRQRVTVEPHRKVVDILDIMVATGLYGCTRAECALRLIEAGVRRELAEGMLGRTRPDLAPKPLKVKGGRQKKTAAG